MPRAAKRSVEALDPWDPAALRWAGMPPMLVRRDRPAGAVALRTGRHQLEPWQDGAHAKDATVLVVCGGVGDGGGVERSVEIYEPDAGRWRRGADMPEGRYGGGCAAHGGLLYLVGGLTAEGFAAPEAALVYDVSNDMWLTAASGNNGDTRLRTLLAPHSHQATHRSAASHQSAAARRPLSDGDLSERGALAAAATAGVPRVSVPLWSPVDHVPRCADTFACPRLKRTTRLFYSRRAMFMDPTHTSLSPSHAC